MSREQPLQRFFQEFGDAITTPLEARAGRLAATPERYPPGLVASAVRGEGLEVYQRQYWLRLAGVFESEFPLTSRLLGTEAFLAAAFAFINRHPPRGVDIGEAADGFERFLAAEEHSDGIVRAAAAIDETWRGVWRAPLTSPWRPKEADSLRLSHARLRAAPGRRVFRSRWAVVEPRHAVLEASATLSAVRRLDVEGAWLIRNGEDGITSMRLEPQEARLIDLLDRHTFAGALAKFEAAVPVEQRAPLPELVRSTLAKWMELGLWSGLA